MGASSRSGGHGVGSSGRSIRVMMRGDDSRGKPLGDRAEAGSLALLCGRKRSQTKTSAFAGLDESAGRAAGSMPAPQDFGGREFFARSSMGEVSKTGKG